MKYRFVGVIFVFMVLAVVGCTSPTSTPVLPNIPEEPLRQIREDLGYVLLPNYLPGAIESCQAFPRSTAMSVVGPDMGEIAPQEPVAYLVCTAGDASTMLEIRYPSDASLEESFMERAAGLERPDDALSTVQVNGRTSHLRRGFWSWETVRQAFDVAVAAWDYDYALSVYFDYLMPDGKEVGVAVVAQVMAPGSPRPDWATPEELIKVAESLRLASE